MISMTKMMSQISIPPVTTTQNGLPDMMQLPLEVEQMEPKILMMAKAMVPIAQELQLVLVILQELTKEQHPVLISLTSKSSPMQAVLIHNIPIQE
jgi:hypothetical protein